MASERILIVDDEPYVRTLMAAMLEKSNYATVLASNGIEAIEHVEQDPPYDLILSDIVMNGARWNRAAGAHSRGSSGYPAW